MINTTADAGFLEQFSTVPGAFSWGGSRYATRGYDSNGARYRVRTALAEYDLAVPPVDHRFSTDRLSDLVYYVMRDFVGHGKLTVPIRDDLLEDIEANRVGERVKVVPRGREIGHGERAPTNLQFEDEETFVTPVL